MIGVELKRISPVRVAECSAVLSDEIVQSLIIWELVED